MITHITHEFNYDAAMAFERFSLAPVTTGSKIIFLINKTLDETITNNLI